jgi:hypothetical protein
VRRCGETSIGGQLGCCRPELHPGEHCAHDAGDLTGTPGQVVAGRSAWRGVRFRRCRGDAGRPLTPWLPDPGATGAETDVLRRSRERDPTT